MLEVGQKKRKGEIERERIEYAITMRGRERGRVKERESGMDVYEIKQREKSYLDIRKKRRDIRKYNSL